ncbi:Autoinducer 2 import ATP-binding protein LsrA [Delftia tsuruhatensis]|uniref:ABC transporter ATP-binding protein n=1 Tax=Delftia tsuruhatensis TaxID=180282 RepID=UPI001E6D5FEC|nr:ABC transporter ATP-binding protein [Delftia tsuruhatensis]CAB5680626.1 Autoinducer 2 import ATP-binding protein LsrA [Delftia tsuruhatensis]CAC9675582.1 Autoinducer 2 import ATP-binding protein LsrA [Delftia tsuruhatensis]
MAESLMRVRGLTRRFGGLTAVGGVDMDLHEGEVHAVIGTNGAGKSTLVNMLSGELAASEGRIELAGRDVTRMPQPLRARAGVGRSYQRTTIFPEFSALENCRLAAQAQMAHRPWQLWPLWQASARCTASLRQAQAALERAGLQGHALSVAGTLSHGAKRQLEVAMCLATGPRVLLLDEPLAGMGAEETERMLALLQQLKHGHAVLLVEHDMDAVFRIADRITVMVNGCVVATGTPAQIRVDPVVRTAYLGEDHE